MLQLDKREPQKTEIVRLVERKEDGKCKKVDNLIHCKNGIHNLAYYFHMLCICSGPYLFYDEVAFSSEVWSFLERGFVLHTKF